MLTNAATRTTQALALQSRPMLAWSGSAGVKFIFNLESECFMKTIRTIILFTSLFIFGSVAHAGDVTGFINLVTIDKSPEWNSAMIQIVDASGNPLSLGESCVSGSSYAMWKLEDELDKALLSIALSAKISNQQVRVFTSGCLSPPEVLANQVKLIAIDLGERA